MLKLGKYPYETHLLQGAEWMAEPDKYTEQMIRTMMARRGGTLMPPSVFVKELNFQWSLDFEMKSILRLGPKRIAFFGPPGSGKSTLVESAREAGYDAVDLEQEGETYAERLAASRKLDPRYTRVVGAGDLKVEDLPDYTPVLLLPPKDTYLSRVAARNAEDPSKVGQSEVSVYEGFSENRSKFQTIVPNEGTPADMLAYATGGKVESASRPIVEIVADWSWSPSAERVYSVWNDRYGTETANLMSNYRSNLAFGCGALQVNELEHRIRKSIAMREFDRIMSLVRRDVDEVDMIIKDALAYVVDHMCEGSHVDEYIQTHLYSSVIPGMKWSSLLGKPELRTDLLESTRTCYQYVLDNWDTQCDLESEMATVVAPFSLGIGLRARPPDGLNALATNFVGKMKRSRIILFSPVFSKCWAFIPGHSKRVYDYVITEIGKTLGMKINCPVTLGGKAWEALKVQLENGGVYQNCDGSGWETWVARGLRRGAPIATILTWPQLFSGSDFTSLAGTSVHACLAKGITLDQGLDVREYNLFGDDGGYVHEAHDGKAKLVSDIPSLYEEDKIASVLKHYLGFTVAPEEEWHAVGRKITIDRADKAIRVKSKERVTLQSHYSEQEIAVIEGVYTGRMPDGRSMRQILRESTFEELDVLSPSNIRDWLAKEYMDTSYDVWDDVSSDEM